jgi:hypothetical protein
LSGLAECHVETALEGGKAPVQGTLKPRESSAQAPDLLLRQRKSPLAA